MFKFLPKQLPPIFICNGRGFLDEFDGVKTVKLNADLSSNPTIPVVFLI
jgi:hypothetical protein